MASESVVPDREILTRLAEGLKLAGIPLDRPAAALTHEISLDQDLGVDSFQLMQVARHLERAYAFRFSIADWVLEEEERDGPAYTIGSLLAFIRRSL